MMQKIKSQFNEPTRTVSGNYFCAAFLDTTLYHKAVIYKEAYRKQGSCKWNVLWWKVEFNEDGEILHSEGTHTERNMSLRKSLRAVAYYITGSSAPLAQSIMDQGEDVYSFAITNGFIMDVDNNVHVLHKGQPVTQGGFLSKNLETAKLYYDKSIKNDHEKIEVIDEYTIDFPLESPQLSKQDTVKLNQSCSYMSDGAVSLHASDLAVMEKRESHLYGSVLNVLRKAFLIHEGGFHPEYVDASQRLRSQEKLRKKWWIEEYSYKQMVERMKKEVDSYGFTPEEKGKYERFLDLIQLSLEVSCSAHLYRRYDVQKDLGKAKQEVTLQMKKMDDLLYHLDVPQDDIQKIHAMIVTTSRVQNYAHCENFARLGLAKEAMTAYFFPKEIEMFVGKIADNARACLNNACHVRAEERIRVSVQVNITRRGYNV